MFFRICRQVKEAKVTFEVKQLEVKVRLHYLHLLVKDPECHREWLQLEASLEN